MTIAIRRVVATAVIACAALAGASAHAASLAYSSACSGVTIGPITLVDTTAFPVTGTIELTPNVTTTGLNVVSIASLRQVNDDSVTSGTFTGTLSCSLTIGSVTVPYTRALSLTIGPPPGNCSIGGAAGGCLK